AVPSSRSGRQLGRKWARRYPAFRCLAAERCALRAGRRCVVLRRAVDRPAPFVAPLPLPPPFRLCFSASIKLITLLGRSSRSATFNGLPAALRRNPAFRAFSFFSFECVAVER